MVIEPHMKQGRQHKLISTIFLATSVTKKLDHNNDELIIEADRRMSLSAVCEQMGRTPPWAKGLLLCADGYECDFYKKD